MKMNARIAIVMPLAESSIVEDFIFSTLARLMAYLMIFTLNPYERMTEFPEDLARGRETG